jgi:hypothetical protein
MNRLLQIIYSISLVTLFVLLFTAKSAMAGSEGATGIVASINKAPVSMDGNLKGKPTDYVLTLDTSLDPMVAGRGLKAGASIKVIFPDDFDLSDLDDYPLGGAGSSEDCVPGNLICTTAVILQGWPQNPIAPPNYALSIEGNAFVFTAVQDIVPNPPMAPGIKQLHLILHGVENPGAGQYQIKVEAETGPAGAVETGTVLLTVVAKTRSSVNLTSVFTGESPNPNTIFQETTVNGMAPYEWSFLMWGKNGKVLDNINLLWLSVNHASLRQDGDRVGQIFIDAPAGATGYDIILVDSTGLPAAPTIGGTPGIGPQPVGLLQLQFFTGSAPGDYVITILTTQGAGSNFWSQVVVTATP